MDVESLDAAVDPWRNEVQLRLQRYKNRRGRRIEGAFTMRFPFPDEADPESASVGTAELETALDPVIDTQESIQIAPDQATEEIAGSKAKASVPMPLAHALAAGSAPAAPIVPSTTDIPQEVAIDATRDVSPALDFRPRPRPRRKVIAFPAPAYPSSDCTNRLADPVSTDQLRILDVPEELEAVPATPFLDGLLDGPSSADKAEKHAADAVELPRAAASGLERIGATAIDLIIVGAGLGIFAAAGYRLLPPFTPTKVVVAGAAVIAVLLWACYEYLFLVYGGRTLGMKMAGLGLENFKGQFPSLRQRRLRAMGIVLSVLALGMGVLWYFVDLDSLCWHDRISQTFPRKA